MGLVESASARLQKHRSEIIALWEDSARRESPAARQQEGQALRNTLSEFLNNLARDLSGESKNGKPDCWLKLGERHGKERASLPAYSLDQLLLEYHLLRKMIFVVLLQDGPLEFWESEMITDSIDRGIMEAGEAFVREKLSTERKTKYLFELLQKIAVETMGSKTAVQRENLNNLIRVVMEILRGVTATLFLLRHDTEELLSTFSVGMPDDLLEPFRLAMFRCAFSEHVKQSKLTMYLADIEQINHEQTGERLKQHGIVSLLGLRLMAREKLAGMLYVGFSRRRSFNEDELRHLESLTSRLSLLLDNARLYEQTVADLEKLRQERELREKFVSMLTHDLRGPMTVAQAGARLIRLHPERTEVNKDLAEKMLKSLTRADRMIQDLLDANRIRAGQKLPLKFEDCDLTKLAKETLDEFATVHGDRFVLHAEEQVVGFWSCEGLRRVMENLITNAIKYGLPHGPITLTVEFKDKNARIAVHNKGSLISAGDKSKLFDAFGRAQSAQVSGKTGWGLGLTLVRGVVEAHGGTIRVESSVEQGTTFVIEVPEAVQVLQQAA